MTRIPLALLAAGLLSTATTANGGPTLPVSLGGINGWAAGKVGVPELECEDSDLGGESVAVFHPPTSPEDEGSIEIDVNLVLKHYKPNTGPSFGLLVQQFVLHEYMHSAGYGHDDGDGLSASDPPTQADCEHFHLHLDMLAFLCDAAVYWTPAGTPWKAEVLADICRLHDDYRAALEALRASFTACGTIPEKTFAGGYTIPAFDLTASLPVCVQC